MMAKQKREYFKFDFRNVVKFDCTCGRRYINTSNCLQTTDSRSPQTNADRIRSMSDEELAEFLINYKACDNCEHDNGLRCEFNNVCVKEYAMAMSFKWLQSEVEEE